MSPPDQKLLEDLCAWMDGELPPDQARFLERRIGNEPALQAQLERWQLAAASLRGQLARHKWPRRWHQAPALPRTALGKVQKPAVRAWLASQAAALD